MIRKGLICFFLFLFSLNLWAAENSGEKSKAGFTLLDSLVTAFQDMAEQGTGGAEVVDARIQPIMAELKTANAERQIDPIFFKRFHRLLIIIKLAIIDISYDRQGILESLIADELNKFIIDITGNKFFLPPAEHRGIGDIAGALSEEILNLYIYLDTEKNREELRKKYFKR